MIRRAKIAAVVVVGLLVPAAIHSPAYGRLVSSARCFQRNFRELRTTGSTLGPLERFLVSVALTNGIPCK